MSEVAPTAIQTVETGADKMIDAVTETVEAIAKPVEAIVEAMPAAVPAPVATKLASVKKPASVKKSAQVKKSAPAKVVAKLAPIAVKTVAAKTVAKVPAKRGPKPRIIAPAAPVVQAARKVNRKAATAVAKRKYVRKAVPVAKPMIAKPAAAPIFASTTSNPFTKGIKIMDTTNWFAGFTAVPGAEKFQSLFADAGEKSQEVVRKGQAFAESMTETARANMEAVVESSRIAAAGARDLGQEVVASTKDGVEKATAAVKTLAEAKSPTEFFQIQSELARSSFDRFVAEGSKLTEQMVKLAGEAVQPLSSRASINAEKFSELTA
ncbi:MAG: TIGR01841 family phasin [Pseudomonadota bacterium]|nr:TIGR01841 family phasin [Pseudomonadota bacterium]